MSRSSPAAASGIGLAAAERFAEMGLKVAIADLPGQRLEAAAHALAWRRPKPWLSPPTCPAGMRCGGSRPGVDRYGPVHVLMNNAGVQPGSSLFDASCSLGTGAGRQSVGTHPRRADVRARDDRARPARHGDEYRLQAGHHHAAGRPRLQRVQGRSEGADRGAGARTAQRTGVPGHRPPADPGLRLHPADRPRPDEKPAAAWTPEQTVEFMLEAWTAATSTSFAPTTTCRAGSTSGGSCGPPRTSSTTAHPCRAGTRIGWSASRRGCRRPRGSCCPPSIRRWRRSCA